MPACRTLDCVSVFALTVDDAWAALRRDGGAGRRPTRSSRGAPLGVSGPMPRPAHRRAAAGERVSSATVVGRGLRRGVARFAALGADIIEIDFEPFLEAARLLYEGPWVAERYLAAQG